MGELRVWDMWGQKDGYACIERWEVSFAALMDEREDGESVDWVFGEGVLWLKR